ncbi:MAG TPA: hypothetical protein VGB50_10605 [Flavobacterium sp.]|jgi:hypothetical protein
MKTIIYTALILMFTTIASAQTDNDAVQDRIQQEPPRETQTGVERAARQAAVNDQNNNNVIDSQDRLESETERSTGKDMKNPALTNPTTVRPPTISDPVSTPVSKQLNPGR